MSLLSAALLLSMASPEVTEPPAWKFNQGLRPDCEGYAINPEISTRSISPDDKAKLTIVWEPANKEKEYAFYVGSENGSGYELKLNYTEPGFFENLEKSKHMKLTVGGVDYVFSTNGFNAALKEMITPCNIINS